jgi:site-specific DNA recombinase
MALAFAAKQSVHATVAQYLIYVRRSYKEATAADVSDEMQEAACRALLPAGAKVRVISDSGGHQSGFTAARDGYRALLEAVREGNAAAIAVYDLSRLHRNARLMLDLKNELEARRVPLLVANLPGANFDGATGRYLFGQLCLASQLQRDLDSERMTGMRRRQFEDGRHRGHDPFGYRTQRDAAGNVVQPRQLVLVPEQAVIVRRLWHELSQRSFDDVAALLNREGVPHPRVWTRDAVKDIWRRGRV